MLVNPLMSSFRPAFVAALLDNIKQRLLLSRASAKCQVRQKLASTAALAWLRGVAVDLRGSVIVVLHCCESQIPTTRSSSTLTTAGQLVLQVQHQH